MCTNNDIIVDLLILIKYMLNAALSILTVISIIIIAAMIRRGNLADVIFSLILTSVLCFLCIEVGAIKWLIS